LRFRARLRRAAPAAPALPAHRVGVTALAPVVYSTVVDVSDQVRVHGLGVGVSRLRLDGKVIQIHDADFDDIGLLGFLREHLDDIAPSSPAETQHALDVDGLRAPGVRLWTARDGELVVGTVALLPVSEGHEELKSMRTSPARRGEGIATRLLNHALHDARERGISRVSLETGSMEFFAAARAFYHRAGFVECPPFGTYVADPHNVFMTLVL
jgi:putative acetyltransferase